MLKKTIIFHPILKKIGVVSGSSWFFTSLYSSTNSFYNDVYQLSYKDFIENWNKNYCDNISTFINSHKLLQIDKHCNIVYNLLHFLKWLSDFVEIPGSNWSDFVQHVILEYKKHEKSSLSINKYYPELLYGITLPFTIFQRNDNNNAQKANSNDNHNNTNKKK